MDRNISKATKEKLFRYNILLIKMMSSGEDHRLDESETAELDAIPREVGMSPIEILEHTTEEMMRTVIKKGKIGQRT